MTKKTTAPKIRFYLFAENFVSGESYRVTKSTTSDVVKAIKSAQTMNDKVGDSTTVSVAKKPRGMMQKIVWQPY